MKKLLIITALAFGLSVLGASIPATYAQTGNGPKETKKEVKDHPRGKEKGNKGKGKGKGKGDQEGLATATIKSSLQCGMCQNTISKTLKAIPGVKKVQTSITQSTITVSYKSDKVTLDQIRQAVSKAGYDADHLKADPQAYQNLPSCCKKP